MSLFVISNIRTILFAKGGLDTGKEMCEAFVHYYPKIPMNICVTGLGDRTTMKYFGIEEYK